MIQCDNLIKQIRLTHAGTIKLTGVGAADSSPILKYNGRIVISTYLTA
jgi:hypothetical protein